MSLNICRHCRDVYEKWQCDMCGEEPEQECRSCHEEAAHGVLPPQDVTNPALPPAHKGLIWRQRAKLGGTDGG